MIYDYLFYKGYQIAKNSEKWEDTPVLFGTIIVLTSFIPNFFTIFFLLEGLAPRVERLFPFMKMVSKYKILIASVFVVGIWCYYSYNDRWLPIVDKYEQKQFLKRISPWVVFIIAYVLSYIFLELSARYKNGQWIFK